MQFLDSLAFWQWIVQSLIIFFIIGGLAGIAVGCGLIACSARTLAFFNTLNGWTSTRRATKPLEMPRDATPVVRKYMRAFAAVFVAGGLYSLYALFAQFNADAIIYALRLGHVHPLISRSLIDAARWILIVGNLAAVVVGILMAFFPAKLAALESRGSRWFSVREMTQAGDRMHTPLDRWVASSPRAAGAIIAVGSLVVVVSLSFRFFLR